MSKIDTLLAHELTRAEFIKLSLIGLLSIFGVANFLSYFSDYIKHSQKTPQATDQKVTKGFGSSKFGI